MNEQAFHKVVFWPLSPRTPGLPCAITTGLVRILLFVLRKVAIFFPSSIYITDLDHVCQINYDWKKGGRREGRESGREGGKLGIP